MRRPLSPENEITWLPVLGIEFHEHSKLDRPPSLRVDFHTTSQRFSDWRGWGWARDGGSAIVNYDTIPGEIRPDLDPLLSA